MHDEETAFFKSAMDRVPTAISLCTQCRAAVWKAFLQLGEQNRFLWPPTFLASKGCPHQGQVWDVMV